MTEYCFQEVRDVQSQQQQSVAAIAATAEETNTAQRVNLIV